MERDEFVNALIMVLFFLVLMTGREMGKIYSQFHEVSQLSIIFDVKEEELAGFVRKTLTGGDDDLEIGLIISLPSARSIEGHVTTMPDYVRRWFISVVVSPIVVRQPEVSDVELQLWVEDELMLSKTFPFEREKVAYLRFLERTINITIEDSEKFRRVIQKSSKLYGGEVELKFTGHVLAHVLFLKKWLPFFTMRYPLMKAPHLEFLSSNWTDTNGLSLEQTSIDRDIFISAHLRNPMRVHSIWENVSATIYYEGSDEPIFTIQKEIGVAPGTVGTYVFLVSIEKPGIYRYVLETPEGFRWDESSQLEVNPVG